MAARQTRVKPIYTATYATYKESHGLKVQTIKMLNEKLSQQELSLWVSPEYIEGIQLELSELALLQGG